MGGSHLPKLTKAICTAHCKVLDGTLTQAILGTSKLRDMEAMKRGRFLESQVLKELEDINVDYY